MICENGNLSVFGNWKLMRNCTKELSWDANFSDVFGSLWLSELLQIIFVGSCSSIVPPGATVDLVGNEVSVCEIGAVLSVVSLLFLFIFEISDVVFVWDCKPWLMFCCYFGSIIFLVIIDWFA